MASHLDLGGAGDRIKTCMAFGNYWLQFAEDQRSMVYMGLERAQTYFAEAARLKEDAKAAEEVVLQAYRQSFMLVYGDNTRLTPVPHQHNGCDSTTKNLNFSAEAIEAMNRLIGGVTAAAISSQTPQQKITNTQLSWCDPIGKELKFSAEAIEAMNRLMGGSTAAAIPSQAQQAKITTTQPSQCPIKTATHHLATAINSSDQQQAPIRTNVAATHGIQPIPAAIQEVLDSQVTRVRNIRQDLAEIEQRIEYLMQDKSVDYERRMDFHRRGMFVDRG